MIGDGKIHNQSINRAKESCHQRKHTTVNTEELFHLKICIITSKQKGTSKFQSLCLPNLYSIEKFLYYGYLRYPLFGHDARWQKADDMVS
jgi:hypothetical protein